METQPLHMLEYSCFFSFCACIVQSSQLACPLGLSPSSPFRRRSGPLNISWCSFGFVRLFEKNSGQAEETGGVGETGERNSSSAGSFER